MESDRALQVQNKRQVTPTENTTSSSLCIKHIRKVRRCLGGGPSDRLAAQGLPGDRPAQSTCAGIHLSWALSSLIFLPQHSTPCQSDKAALWRHLACSGHSWVEASSPAALSCASGALWYLLCAPDGSSASSPHLLHTHFKLSSVFQESRKYLLKIFMQKLFMAWPTSTPWQPLHNTAQRSPYLEEHTDNFAAHKSPRSNSSGFSIKSGTWGLDVQFRCQVFSSRLCQAAFSCLPIWRGLW